MNITRGTIILACVATLFLTVGAANLCADPIESMDAHLVDTLFAPGGGSFGLGVLSLQKTTAVTVVRTGGTTTTTDFFSLTTDLQSDVSAGGLAHALFSGGSITLMSADLSTTHLTANVQSLELEEPFDDMGILAGSGTFVVTGGDYQADFGDAGKMVLLTFHIVPKVMADFSNRFTGTTDVMMTPTFGGDVPEPATLLLVGSGAIGLLGVLRRRRMK